MSKITAVDLTTVSPNHNGGNYVRAELWTTTEPDTLPTSGEGIIGMSDKDTFAAGSSLIATTAKKAWLVGEDGGNFELQKGWS